jgi:hypothetical protein
LCVHRCREGLDINEVVVTEDGVEVGMLGEVDGASVAVTHNSDAEHPVEFAKVSDLDVAAEPGLEVFDEMCGAGGNGAIIDVHSDDNELLDLRQEFVEDGLVDK